MARLVEVEPVDHAKAWLIGSAPRWRCDEHLSAQGIDWWPSAKRDHCAIELHGVSQEREAWERAIRFVDGVDACGQVASWGRPQSNEAGNRRPDAARGMNRVGLALT